MTVCRRALLLVSIFAVSGAALHCGGGTTDPPPPAACSDSVQVSITMQDTLPLISWTPDCLIGRVLIEEGIDEYWGTETCGVNTYRSPILFDHNPPDTCPEEVARPLEHGHTYRVRLFRWISYNPPAESLAVVGETHFRR